MKFRRRSSAGGSWDSPEAAYEAGVAAGRRGDLATAARATAEAQELFRARRDATGRAGAARCAWRLANYQAAGGAVDQAFSTGRQAIEEWTAVVDESDDVAWNRELVRTCADVSVFGVMAGRHDDAVELAARAAEIARTAHAGGRDPSREMQTEMGTALHNLAAAHSARAVAGGPLTIGERARDDLTAALRAADEEVRVRRALAPPGRPDLATWELASGLSQRGRIRMVAGEPESARYDLREARDLAGLLGVAGLSLVQEATTVLRQLGDL
jgi:hypothetical protein